MRSRDFIQAKAYADHFESYRSRFSRLADHDPAMFDLSPDMRIVDVGCGFGDQLGLLRERGFSRLIGVEPDVTCRMASQEKGLMSGTAP